MSPQATGFVIIDQTNRPISDISQARARCSNRYEDLRLAHEALKLCRCVLARLCARCDAVALASFRWRDRSLYFLSKPQL